jgi:CubicO group peptidase (beta-lactamase class C family)
VAYSKGVGVADLDSKKPVTPSSVFQMASISKGMTAVAVMQLVEQGKVDLDAPVTEYLPYFTMADARYRDITVRQLLSHTSGLADDFGHELKDVPDPMAQAVRDLADQALLSAPGDAWSYSRVGFTLLGQVIAEVTGMRFEDYMQQKILTPLGMEHATFLAAEVDPDLGVTKYVNKKGGGVAVNQIQDCDARDAPACMLHANCEDMARWARAHLNRGELDGVRILNAESYDELWGPVASTPYAGYLGPVYGPPWQTYGLGWAMGKLQGHWLVGHTGGVYGTNTQIQMAPDDGLAVIVLANWLDNPVMGPFYATQAAIDVLYLLLGIDVAQLK